MTGVLFKIPIIRHVYTWMSASNADKMNCLKLLESGISVTLNPGGVAEVAELGNRKERTLFLKNRFGFTKLALEAGVPIVPGCVFIINTSHHLT